MRIQRYFALPLTAAVAGLLAGCGGSSNSGQRTYTQFDRLARPAVNEVFATIANNRHQINDTDNPTDDGKPGHLIDDIQTFMTHTAGRRQDITDVVKAVLIPDILVADLSQPGPAAYLGVETGGLTGGKFGGRKLTDDVVDTSLAVIFGNVIPANKLNTPPAGQPQDDGKEIPALTTDNVGPMTAPKHFQDGSAGFGAAAFPYLGPPQ